VAAAQSNPEVGAVQPKLVFRGRADVIQNAGIVLLSDGSAGDRGAGQVDRGQFDRQEEVFGGCGAALLLRREMLADVGDFDETFFAYYEDTDLAWRMRLRGWRAIFEPSAVVEHVHAATNRPASTLMRFYADRNRLFTVLKNAPWAFVRTSFASLGRRGLVARPGATVGRGRGHRARVAGSFAVRLPEMLLKRREIRSRRCVPDVDVLAWLQPRDEWDRRLSG
jgi:GT2 family glycosyltransferase